MTGIKSELNWYHFIEKSMRGGISYSSQRNSKANNDANKPFKQVIVC